MSQYNNDYYGRGGGGGGYMTGGSPYSATASPGGGQKSELSASLRPVTVAQLNKATQQHSEAEWRLDDSEIGQITVVGSLSSIQQQATNSVYAIDDGTGRIEARQWFNTDSDSGIQDGLRENVYVRVTGTLKAFNTKRYINTTHIRVITDPHEVMFHTLEAIAITLSIERGTPLGGGGGASRSKDVVMGDVSAYTAQSAGPSDNFSNHPPVERKILRFLQDNHGTADSEGIHVAAIARAVGSSGDAQLISGALDSLMDQGVVFTTTDESHFALAQ